MNLPQVYMCSPSWTLLPPPSPYHPSGSSQCTSPKHPLSCIEPGLATRFIHHILHVSMPFSQIFPPSPSPTESIRLFYTSVSLLLSCTQGYCYHLIIVITTVLKSLSTKFIISVIFVYIFIDNFSLHCGSYFLYCIFFTCLINFYWNQDIIDFILLHARYFLTFVNTLDFYFGMQLSYLETLWFLHGLFLSHFG